MKIEIYGLPSRTHFYLLIQFCHQPGPHATQGIFPRLSYKTQFLGRATLILFLQLEAFGEQFFLTVLLSLELLSCLALLFQPQNFMITHLSKEMVSILVLLRVSKDMEQQRYLPGAHPVSMVHRVRVSDTGKVKQSWQRCTGDV